MSDRSIGFVRLSDEGMAHVRKMLGLENGGRVISAGYERRGKPNAVRVADEPDDGQDVPALSIAPSVGSISQLTDADAREAVEGTDHGEAVPEAVRNSNREEPFKFFAEIMRPTVGEQRLRDAGIPLRKVSEETADRGLKFDDGKAPVWRGVLQYFPRAIKAVALVSAFGFEKYKSWGGWRNVPDAFGRYSDAYGRHMLAEAMSEPLTGQDARLLELFTQVTPKPTPEVVHAAQEAWNALARLEIALSEAA
jgi:hypothetical protein